jgi:hypothetical protein
MWITEINFRPVRFIIQWKGFKVIHGGCLIGGPLIMVSSLGAPAPLQRTALLRPVRFFSSAARSAIPRRTDSTNAGSDHLHVHILRGACIFLSSHYHRNCFSLLELIQRLLQFRGLAPSILDGRGSPDLGVNSLARWGIDIPHRGNGGSPIFFRILP